MTKELVLLYSTLHTMTTYSKKDLLSSNDKFVLFNETSGVRREWYNDERYYSIVDIIAILTESKDWGNYWYVLKQRLSQEWSDVLTNCKKLKLLWADGKKYPGDTGNTQQILRIIQSIPSPRAEPLKRRLASLGDERFQEMNDPELWLIRARERAIAAYRAKGRTDDQIQTRLQSIDTRHKYTDELKKRGIKEGLEYAILTNKWYARTGMNTKQLKEFKGLGKHHNLRDNMTGLELILTDLQEEASKEFMRNKNAQGFSEVSECVDQSVEATKDAKEVFEKRGLSVVKPENTLTERQKRSLKKK